MLYLILLFIFGLLTHKVTKMDRKGCITKQDYQKRYRMKWGVIIYSIFLQFVFRKILILNIYFLMTTIEWCIKANRDREALIRIKRREKR